MSQQTGLGPRESLIRADAASLLYRHGFGGLLVSISAASLLAQLCGLGTDRFGVLVWWCAMLVILLARAAHVLRWYRVTSKAATRDGDRECVHFSIGVLASALMWGAFPVLFFDRVSLVEQAAMAAALIGLAGVATTILSPSIGLCSAYLGIVLLPMASSFMMREGAENRVLGVLTVICFLTLNVSARIAHNALVQSLRLSRLNQELLVEKEQEHERTAKANFELRALQKALEDANQGLEIKVRDQTDKLVEEIRERERYEQELSRLASTDPLTGLCNRSMLTGKLNAALSGMEHHRPIAVLFIDLDDFKQVNDVRGHHAGDRVIATVAERLCRAVGSQADIGRWGGDEFVVVLREGATAEAAARLAVIVREQVIQPIDTGGDTVWVDVTIGISLFPDHGETHDKLIRAADLAMYAAKQNKHHRIRIFDPALADQVAKGHYLGQCLSEAIANQKLTIVFQPIVAATRGHCIAMEALVRWDHPDHGPIPPSEFIPMAERSGDILSLGRWVLIESCRAAAGWPGETPPAVSVNVSAAQFLAGFIVEDVKDALSASGLAPERLHLELTETAFAGDYESVVPVLTGLRAMGVRISLDDFGTGFSSLSYLHNLPVDTLKIDKAFVAGMDGESKAIVRASVSLARALGYGVVAEGVETERQRSVLLSLGVEQQQGYLYSRPLAPEAIPPWLWRWQQKPGVRSIALAEITNS
jgi:diguanylate cyclase (GGDEF)-like protein